MTAGKMPSRRVRTVISTGELPDKTDELKPTEKLELKDDMTIVSDARSTKELKTKIMNNVSAEWRIWLDLRCLGAGGGDGYARALRRLCGVATVATGESRYHIAKYCTVSSAR
jgi:hypothetical protein